MRHQGWIVLFFVVSCGNNTTTNSPADFASSLVGTWNPVSSTVAENRFGHGPLILANTQTSQDGQLVIDGQLFFGEDHSFYVRRVEIDEGGCLVVNHIGQRMGAWFINTFEELVLEIGAEQVLVPSYSIKGNTLTLTFESGGVETYNKVNDIPPRRLEFNCDTDHIYLPTIFEVHQLLTTALADATKKTAGVVGRYTGEQSGAVEVTATENQTRFAFSFEAYSDDVWVVLDGTLQVELRAEGRKYQGTLSLSGRYNGRLEMDLAIENGTLVGTYGLENGMQIPWSGSGYIDGYPPGYF